MRDLCSREFFRDAFAPHQANSPRRNGLQRSIIVQLIGGRIPKQRIHIEKIMFKQLLDGMRFSCARHIGVIFDAPEIENHPLGAKPALCSPERVRGLVRLAKFFVYLVNRARAENHHVHIGRPDFNIQRAIEKEVP